MAEPEKKIIVDDDWKAQARAEKEKLAEQADTGKAGAPAGPEELPPADFAGLVNALVSNIVYALGGYEDPQTHKRYVDLQLGKHYVDLLSVLEAKTRGNLSEDEKKLMDAALYQVRMQYVQIAQRAAQI
jgi:hypothetical protein